MNPALTIFEAGLAAVDPYRAVMAALSISDDTLQIADRRYDLTEFDNIYVLGAGKATARMALAVEFLLGERIVAGAIVVKYGHCVPLRHIKQFEADHPVPDQAGVVATHHILQLAYDADERSLVITLLSGGASALLVAPTEGITLKDKQQTTRLLLNAGADIRELNAVRKHLSAIKGGRLAQAVYPAQSLTLILSDVIGDPLEVIASGPTAPDDSTYAEAMQVIRRYELVTQIPQAVLRHLQAGQQGLVAESVKRNAPCWGKTQNMVVANLRLALHAALDTAQQQGFSSRIVNDAVSGEAREVALQLAELARQELAQMQSGERRCLLSGGETTVTVRGKGQGGRNQELALAFAIAIAGMRSVSLFSAGTDGTDGPNDAAGAYVDGATVAKVDGLAAHRYLEDNDSYAYFQQLDEMSGGQLHFKPGPTGTNVMDMQILLLQK